MNMNNFLILFSIFINLLTLTFVINLFLSLRKQNGHNDLNSVYLKIKDDIRFSLQPMSDIPVGVEEITDLATEVWKIEQRLAKAGDSITDIHKKGLDNSIQRLKKYLQKFDVEIHDYTGQKYNDGFNFDVLSREQDSLLTYPIVKETVEPTITCRGRVVKKAKVILASNQI